MIIKWKLVALFIACAAFAVLVTVSICPYPYECGYTLWLR